MTDSQLIPLAVILLLLALDLLTQAAQASLLNARHVRLLALRLQMEPGVAHTLDLMGELPRLRASLRFLKGFLRAMIFGLALTLFNPGGNISLLTIAGTLLLTALALWMAEFLVEWLVLRDPEAWALRLTLYGRALVTILTPLTALLLLIFPSGEDGEKPIVVTEDELKTLVDAGQQEGVLEQDEREMIHSIFRFGDTLAREIMIPRIDVFALNLHTPIVAAVDALLNSGYSRIPVYEDTIDNVLGLLYAKDLLRVWREGNQDQSTLRELLRPATFIPEAKKVADLLAEMQARRVHMAIVVDEYGGMAGLVTLEDIVEEIIGEIQDEYDQTEELPFQKVGQDEYIFHGRIDLDDFDVLMNSHLGDDQGEAETLGGLIYSRIGRVPKGGESLQVADIQLTIEQVIGRRIRKVRAQRIIPMEPGNEEKAHADR